MRKRVPRGPRWGNCFFWSYYRFFKKPFGHVTHRRSRYRKGKLHWSWCSNPFASRPIWWSYSPVRPVTSIAALFHGLCFRGRVHREGRMILILTWEPPNWCVHDADSGAEGRAETIEDAFTALYDAIASDEPQIGTMVVTDGGPTPGIYRIKVNARAEGRLHVISTDIIGLSFEGPAEDVLMALPELVADLLSEQAEAYSRHT